MERNILDFIDHHVEVVRDVDRATAEAHWRALTESTDEAWREFEARREELSAIYRDREHYARFRAYDEEGARSTPGLARQLRVLRLRFAREQIPTDTQARLTESADAVARTVRIWRVQYAEEKLPLAEALRRLSEARDEATRRGTWEACMELGETLGPDVIRLIGVRNRVARDLNFADFHTLECRLNELDGIEPLVKDVKRATDPLFATLREEAEAEVRNHVDASPEPLTVWHLDGLWVDAIPGQAPPNHDHILGADPIEKAGTLFAGVGLDIEPVLKDGAISVEATHGRRAELVLTDRDAGRTRLRCVVGTDGSEFDRLITFLVRALATRAFEPSLPWVLRDAPHGILLDAVARMLARMARSEAFLTSLGEADAARAAAADVMASRRRDLLGMRRALAVSTFEHELYADPGQDLTRRWWETFETHLGLSEPRDRRARFDWATLIDLTTAPLRARRDIITELARAQMTEALRIELGGADWGRKEIGALLTERVFAPGCSLDWSAAVTNMTGETLAQAAWVAAVSDEHPESRS